MKEATSPLSERYIADRLGALERACAADWAEWCATATAETVPTAIGNVRMWSIAEMRAEYATKGRPVT